MQRCFDEHFLLRLCPLASVLFMFRLHSVICIIGPMEEDLDLHFKVFHI